MLLKAIDIAQTAGATLHGNAAQNFEAFAFDSRRIHAAIPSCFIALVTPHADGHHYIEEAISLPRGNIFHRDLDFPFIDGSGTDLTWGSETSDKHIFLAGAGVRRGGGVSGIAGHNAAMAALSND